MNLILALEGFVLLVHNYNGDGEWSVEGIIRRYEDYCLKFQLTARSSLRAKIHAQDDTQWIYPIMDSVIDGIKADDPACTELGIDFICESRSFPFGMSLKSRTARALKKATLTPKQEDRIRSRVAQMLLKGYLPQEYRFYARLLRRTGLGEYKEVLSALEPHGHRMTKYVNYIHALVGGG